jgi:ferrochelatase
MKKDGVGRALAFVTSAYSSYSGCRQYREDIQRAQEAAGSGAPVIDKIRAFYNHPGFIETMVANVSAALAELPGALVLFTAHSIPISMAKSSRYEEQIREASGLVAGALAIEDWRMVWQSRSGPPSQPWLEPDIGDVLRQTEAREVVIVPIGFISDHMEVLYDLDEEARHICEERGIRMARASTAGTHPRFVSMIRELIVERIEEWTNKPAFGVLGANHDICPIDCCPAPKR